MSFCILSHWMLRTGMQLTSIWSIFLLESKTKLPRLRTIWLKRKGWRCDLIWLMKPFTVYLIFCKVGIWRTTLNSWTLGKLRKTNVKTQLSFNQEHLIVSCVLTQILASHLSLCERQTRSEPLSSVFSKWPCWQVSFQHTPGKHPHRCFGLTRAEFYRSQSRSGVFGVKMGRLAEGGTLSNRLDFVGHSWL